MKLSEVEGVLLALGFAAKHQQGSHRQYERPADGVRPRSVVTVDMAEREFDQFLLKSIIRQANFTRDEFYGATKRTAQKAGVKYFRPSTTSQQD